MASEDHTGVWTTISYDRQGNILEVRDPYGKLIEGKVLADAVPEKATKCPDGETEITAVKTVQITYVTCANTKDPCWVYNPVTKQWYYVCG